MRIRSRLKNVLKKVNIPSDLEVIRSNPPVVLNFSEEIKEYPAKKRALLSYLSQPVVDSLSGGTSVRFSNDGLATSWPKVLNKLGYTVDIINWDDCDFKFRTDYDLVIGHGGINFENLKKQLSPTSHFIYFSTGSYWKYHNAKEKERFEYFKKRHGISLPNDRFIGHSEESANKLASAIVCLGNEELAATFSSFKNVFSVPIGSFTTEYRKKTKGDLECGRKDILFIAGAGNIHKGLDLVLDALEYLPDFRLHIYTFMDSEFSNYYKDSLAQPNVILYDFEAFPSDKFFMLSRKCNVAIMPSCSEGSPGSIVESMIQGLIPIVSHESHIDVDDFGVLLKDNTVETIRETLINTSVLPIKELRKRSLAAQKTALSRHSKKSYEKSLLSVMRRIEVSLK